MMEGLCEARLKKQGHLSIEKLLLACSKVVLSRSEQNITYNTSFIFSIFKNKPLARSPKEFINKLIVVMSQLDTVYAL